MSSVRRYRKKPIIVEAMQWLRELPEAAVVMNWLDENDINYLYGPHKMTLIFPGGWSGKAEDVIEEYDTWYDDDTICNDAPYYNEAPSYNDAKLIALTPRMAEAILASGEHECLTK